MKSLRNLGDQPAGIPLVADDILEFHAARLLLLLKVCGVRTRATGLHRLDGLTKMAKLDFFVRYPHFIDKVLSPARKARGLRVESSMVRHHYGPWDYRYYHVLAYLKSRGLFSVSKQGKTVVLTLTQDGQDRAEQIAAHGAFGELVHIIKCVKRAVGSRSGSQLKNLIYETFKEEVAERSLGEVIE